jgi:metabolite-proton symporter
MVAGVTATVWDPDAGAIAAAAIRAASISRGRIGRHPSRGRPLRFRTAREVPATDARPARCYYRELTGSLEFFGLLDSIPRPDAPQTRRILFASLIGTTIEFFDFYIYATAAVLVFPKLFFPKGDPGTAMLQSLATFALAFFARPIGSALFGHFGDRIGRKATLVTALLTMGVSTVCIGLLPTYASIGVWAAGLLALCRIGQGVGLGGEWGGAVLLATENAPPGKQAWYGCFPQLGAPLGFLCSTGVFLLMSNHLNETQLFSWGWRVPFLASAALVLVGLYVRLQLVETPAFQRSVAQGERVRVPLAVVFAKYSRRLILGTLGATTTFVVFYLMTVFALGWATGSLGFGRQQFLILQMAGVLFFGLTIPLSAIIADRISERAMLMIATVLIIAFGFVFRPLFSAHSEWSVFVFLALGFSLTGLTYGPLGSALAKMFPTAVRYTGTSLSFNLAGILGASLAPSIATFLASHYGAAYVGYYLSAAGLVTLIALLLIRADG